MAQYNRARFNKTLFNANTQPQGADSMSLADATSVLTIQVSDPFAVIDNDANIAQNTADSATLSEIGILVVPISDSDNATETESAIAVTVQTSDNCGLFDTINTIIAALSSADAHTLSDIGVIYPLAVDSATESETALITNIASDSAMMSENTNLTFAISIINATVVTQTALGSAAGLAIRTTPVLSQVSGILFVQEKTASNTNGSCIMRVAAGIRMLYEIELADYSWKPLATASIVTDGNIGTAARVTAGLPIGVQAYKTVTGNLLNLFGLPSQSLLIRMTTSCIDKAGTFHTRELATLPIGSGGAVSVGLVSTADLYAPDGTTPLYEIVQNKPNYPRIGRLPFSVPAGAGPFTFGVSAGSIIVH